MSNVVTEVVVSSTRPSLQVTVTDRNGVPVDLTGASAAPRLQGKSAEVPAVTIDLVGTIVGAASGRVDFTSLGTLVTHAQLVSAGVTQGTFTCRVKWFDAAAKWDYGDPTYLRFSDTPI